MALKGFAFAALFLCAASAHAWEDENRYVQSRPYQPDFNRRPDIHFTEVAPPTFADKVKTFAVEVFKGGVQGDFIEKPNIPNLAGQIGVDFSPAFLVGAVRDTWANALKSYESGYRDHKVDTVVAATIGFAVVKDISRAGKIFKAEYELAKSVREGYVVSDLPKLAERYAAAFEGPIEAKVLKKGEVVYRTPFNVEAEAAREPRRWFGFADTQTKEINNGFYNHEAYGNINDRVRKYVVKEDVTVYVGKVKDGIGYQGYIPDHIDPKEVLEWVGTRKFK